LKSPSRKRRAFFHDSGKSIRAPIMTRLSFIFT